MLFFRHPRPVVDQRAVPVQVAQHQAPLDPVNNVLIVPAQKKAPAALPATAPEDDKDKK